ncbi:carboxypeptidase a [Diaporthe amygdali]|uniref:carboxypeptidase a n=1 Tax=Phomopsis amygdali TaxID=1214568 RepID=UPI0022FDFB67|nr:carboxypeptidase a [Diaporthe amygdali]KAJ0123269.1 carboxypeptidase a [Diaporthe amygdali]
MHSPSIWAGFLGCVGLASGCLLPEEREGLPRVVPRAALDNGTPIGTGDRFSGGSIAPQGLGTRASSTSFSTILSTTEIKSGFDGLANEYGLETFTTPYKTYGGATIFGGKVGGTGTCNKAYRVYFNGGIHARERGSSDGVLYFISDLLYANATGAGLTYGSKSYTNAQVKTALAAGIVFVPLSNPDGVAYDQSSNSCWRKNRNPASSTGSASSIGVDLNRNFDFLWDFTKKFASSAQSSVASTSPSSETYHGTKAFSEPETHWGSDTNQNKYSYINFLNTTYDGYNTRGVLTDTPGSGKAYGEYTPSAEQTANVQASDRMAAAMSASKGRSYTSMQAAALYPTSGASDDYSYSRHFADPSLNLVHGYTVEFGFGNSAASCPFYPTVAQYNTNLREVGAGFMEFILAATDLGLGGGC